MKLTFDPYAVMKEWMTAEEKTAYIRLSYESDYRELYTFDYDAIEVVAIFSEAAARQYGHRKTN
jgi:hypothetical protein